MVVKHFLGRWVVVLRSVVEYESCTACVGALFHYAFKGLKVLLYVRVIVPVLQAVDVIRLFGCVAFEC